MKPETITILRTPGGARALQHIIKESTQGNQEEALLDSGSKKIFPIRHGVPIFYDKDDDAEQKQDQFYQVIAPVYDLLHHIQSLRKGGEQKMREEYLGELAILPGDRVLEVSVGTGANLRYLSEDAQYIGLDISWEMLKRCLRQSRRHNAEVELVLGDAQALPFADNSFDIIFNALGFRQIPDKHKALTEMIRVVKPGGKVMVADQLKTGVPVELLPSKGIVQVKTREIEGWQMYCLTFHKAK